ncbi:MAG: 30S ribosomal protein S13 [Candidatus Bathyarchaeota archaeon]|nr:30S ribosomal protein S13 [Candidatus Bathyarchaeota archaeon]MDH5713838.1 30S ribosomal protein S13 [Candidatus Bathyarchaeota archaeon]
MSKEFQHIIRIAGADLDGAQKVGYALTRVNGIGIRLANVITQKAGVDPQIRLGFLPEADIEKIEDVLRNPTKYGLPSWILNRPKNRETGKDVHLIGPDLTLQIKSDIDEMKKVKSWKGFRHSHGLKARGQRTKTTGRKAKAVGVRKKQVRISRG